MYGNKNSSVYSIAGELTAKENAEHIKSSKLGKLLCVVSVGVNNSGREHTINRLDGASDYMLLYIERGEVQFNFNTTFLTIKARSLIIVPPDTPYAFKPMYGSKTKWIHFLGNELLEQFGLKTNYVYEVGDAVGINRLFRLGLEVINGQSTLKQDLLSIYGAEMLGIIANNESKSMMHESDGIERAINAMHSSYKSNATIEEFAEVAGYSQKVFTNKFKARTGKTPKEYIVDIRLEKISEYIRNTTGSIVDIAINHGFNNYEYFVKLFKKRTGITPSEYRKKFK